MIGGVETKWLYKSLRHAELIVVQAHTDNQFQERSLRYNHHYNDYRDIKTPPLVYMARVERVSYLRHTRQRTIVC